MKDRLVVKGLNAVSMVVSSVSLQAEYMSELLTFRGIIFNVNNVNLS